MEDHEHKYQYSPLNGFHEIRVLELTAYDQKSMIFDCTLRIIDLDDREHLSYHALSYTWQLPKIEEEQAPSRPSPIQVRCDGRLLHIQENLFDCLYQVEHLPQVDESNSYLWIDAICINQADLAERSSQVAMMQEIYSKAAGTLIWLGRQNKYSLKATPLIKKLSQVADSLLLDDKNITLNMMLTTGQLQDETFFASAGIAPLTLLDWKAISSFFSRSWFHRLWTVQELVMGDNDSKAILCGKTWLRLDDIGGFIQLAMVKGWVNSLRLLEFNHTGDMNTGAPIGIEISLAMGAIYRASLESDMSNMLQHVFGFRDEESFLTAKFAWMLHMCRQKKATDERDRIFASGGMISQYRKPGSWHLLDPDYSKATEIVFANASKFILESLGNLSWLSFVQDRSLKITKDLPSWAPDLATMGRPTSFAIAGSHDVFQNRTNKPGEGTQGAQFLILENSLSVKGCKIDMVVDTVYNLNDAFMSHCFLDMIIAASKVPTYGPDSWLEALMKTWAGGMASDLDLDNGPVIRPSQNFSLLWDHFLHFLKLQLVQEIYSWGPRGATDWWGSHPEFAQLCALNNALPSREEIDELVVTFTTYYDAHRETQLIPLIADKEYLDFMYNPAMPYLQRCVLTCTCRSFIQTQDCRMGLAPLSAQADDEIWIVEGAKIPFVLRPRLDGGFEFMGEAYVHGIMQGELFDEGKQLEFQDVVLL